MCKCAKGYYMNNKLYFQANQELYMQENQELLFKPRTLIVGETRAIV